METTLARSIGIAAALVLVAGPLGAAGIGVLRAGRAPATAAAAPQRRRWRLPVASTLAYVLAFNLTFFIQELFLVLPKAFVPGLRPTLYHNNHGWQGDHPLASLFQGTGALAIFLSGVICALALRRITHGPTAALLLVWMAFNGFFQALPQVVIGAIHPGNDVGTAMAYLGLGSGARLLAAVVALCAMPAIAFWLTRQLLATVAGPEHVASPSSRAWFILSAATLPALVAVPLIVPFRVPRELVEVVLPPIVVTVIGVSWMQAWAWHADGVRAVGGTAPHSIAWLATAVIALLFVFQVLLRPGVPFY